MSTSNTKKLGWFLCWAVVFADIGTSLYYVPGILYGEVKDLAGLFVSLSSIVFILLALKYVEITDRYSEGGGVVTVATSAFGPWFGALGGMLIIVDYFLTASISSVSGFAYLNSIIPMSDFIVWGAALSVIALGLLNLVGIKESAGVTAVIATAAFIVDVILLAFVITQVKPEGWQMIMSSFGKLGELTPFAILSGYAGSFLAFSGLESISQLSPAMETPRKKIAGIAMALVVASIIVTSPLLTLFSTNLLDAKLPGKNETILHSINMIKQREHELTIETDTVKKAELQIEIKEAKEYSERFVSELGAQYGGSALKIAVVATASVLLIFASNTAIIGSYHVFIALARAGFLPMKLMELSRKFGTPTWSVLLAITPPVLIIFATKGDMSLLGQLYAFGLLGAFSLSSIGLDVVRWKESKKLSPMFIIGVITSILVVIAWMTNLYSKLLATIFGGAVTLVGMIIAIVMKQYVNKGKTPVLAHEEVHTESVKIVPQGQIYVPVYDEFDAKFMEYVGEYAKNINKEVVLMYVRQYTDVLGVISEDLANDEEASTYLTQGAKILNKYNVKVHEMYAVATNAGEVINKTRKTILPYLTFITPHKSSLIVQFLRGSLVDDVINYKNGPVMIYSCAK
jgi:amino acid transporter